MLGSIRKFWPSRLFGGGRLTRIIHEGFYYNRRYAATTSLTAGGLAAQSVNILLQVCLPPSRLRAPVSLGVSSVSSRTLVNKRVKNRHWSIPVGRTRSCLRQLFRQVGQRGSEIVDEIGELFYQIVSKRRPWL